MLLTSLHISQSCHKRSNINALAMSTNRHHFVNSILKFKVIKIVCRLIVRAPRVHSFSTMWTDSYVKIMWNLISCCLSVFVHRFVYFMRWFLWYGEIWVLGVVLNLNEMTRLIICIKYHIQSKDRIQSFLIAPALKENNHFNSIERLKQMF